MEYHAECTCKASRSLSIAIGTTDTVILGPNPRRRAVILSAPSTNPYSVSVGQAAQVGYGVTMWPGQAPLALTYGTWGESLCQDIHVIFATAGETTAFTEITA